MVNEYCSKSKHMKIGDIPVWVTYLVLQLIGIGYTVVMTDHVFPLYPTVAGIPFFLVSFLPAFLIFAVPWLFTDLGEQAAIHMPVWVTVMWGCVRLVIESTIQMHHAYGVKGISSWLLWPIQACEEYTITYPIIGEVTRNRGGNFDAFSCATCAIPVAIIIAIVNDDCSGGTKALGWILQLWMVIYLNVGPFLHFLQGMPGPNNIFDFGRTPKESTRMDGLYRGVVGVCANFAGSYAVVHFVVFMRKFTDDPALMDYPGVGCMKPVST